MLESGRSSSVVGAGVVEVGDHVFLRVTPTIGVGRAIRSRKLFVNSLAPIKY